VMRSFVSPLEPPSMAAVRSGKAVKSCFFHRDLASLNRGISTDCG